MAHALNQVIRDVTLNYLDSIDVDNPPTEQTIEVDILEALATEIRTINATREPGTKWKIPQKLNFSQIADIMAHLYEICCIKTAGPGASADFDLLAIYISDGADEGIYVTDAEVFRRIVKKYNYTITQKEFNECMAALRDLVPHKNRTLDKDLIPVNNGIFDYKQKKLLPFDPEFIYLQKCRVPYNPFATNPIITNPDGTLWNVETWVHDLTDDDGITNLLWQVAGAVVRPFVSWNKSIWFYSQKGNNGKGTFCLLLKQLVGEGAYISLKLDEMGKEFALEPLIHAQAIITDENDVGIFVDKCANIKAIITSDTVQINRKYKTSIPFKPHVVMVQCINEMPRIKDKSDSFFRRQIFIPFNKCFTGKERKYIKDDYLRRPEVLEYVLYKVLNMDYEEFDVPESCKNALDEYKEFNDPIRQFFNDVVERASWDIMPFALLYEMYLKWFKANNPSGTPQNRNTFINDIVVVANQSEEWVCENQRKQIRIGNKMSCCEPLLDEFECKTWYNKQKSSPSYSIEDRCTPVPGQYPDRQRGIYRIGADDDDNIIPIVIANDD